MTVVAPAGYGKTTFVAEWAAHSQGPVAWLSLDRNDNDPAILFSYLIAALDRHRPVGRDVDPRPGSDSRTVATDVVPRLIAHLQDWDPPPLIVLDNLEVIEEQSCLDALAELVDLVPPGIVVALVSRSAIRLPLSRLVPRGELVELGPLDLAMDVGEVIRLARATDGTELPQEEAVALVEATEGWAAAIVMARRRGFRAAETIGPAPVGTAMDDRLARYICSEVLAGRSRSEVLFLTRTSILDRLTPGLCDAVVGRPGSGPRLEALRESNTFVVSLDAEGRWYRYHSLFREALRRRLDEGEPSRVRGLHGRAVRWYADNGMADVAVDHAFAADDLHVAGALVARQAHLLQYSGRTATVGRWLARFPREHLERAPWLAVLGAWQAALQGDADMADRFADVVEDSDYVGPTPDGSASFASARAMLRAVMVREGLDAARREAELAVALEGPQSPWRPVALLQLAMTQIATGQTESAGATVEAGVEAARALELAGPLIAHLSVHAQLALDRGDYVAAEGLATAALAVVRRARMEEYGASLLCRALLAGFTGRRGDRTLAKRELASLQHLRVKVSSPTPLLSVFWLRALVRAHADAHDLPGARTVLREIEHIMRSRPELGQVALSIVELRRMLAADGSGEAGPSTLTNAEMRVLQLLPTHLSLPEIADRLVVAYSTVKAQAHAIYGKLGASTRTEAVRAAFDAGLLEPELRSLARYALGEAPSDAADID